jgi:hypothetical protein
MTGWWWLVIGVVLVGTVLTVTLLVARPSSSALGWDREFASATSEAHGVADELAPAVAGLITPQSAANLWARSRPRVVALERALLDLEESAPDAERIGAAAPLRAAVDQIRGALDTEVGLRGSNADPADVTMAHTEVERARVQLAAILAGLSESR